MSKRKPRWPVRVLPSLTSKGMPFSEFPASRVLQHGEFNSGVGRWSGPPKHEAQDESGLFKHGSQQPQARCVMCMAAYARHGRHRSAISNACAVERMDPASERPRLRPVLRMETRQVLQRHALQYSSPGIQHRVLATRLVGNELELLHIRFLYKAARDCSASRTRAFTGCRVPGAFIPLLIVKPARTASSRRQSA